METNNFEFLLKIFPNNFRIEDLFVFQARTLFNYKQQCFFGGGGVQHDLPLLHCHHMSLVGTPSLAYYIIPLPTLVSKNCRIYNFAKIVTATLFLNMARWMGKTTLKSYYAAFPAKSKQFAQQTFNEVLNSLKKNLKTL